MWHGVMGAWVVGWGGDVAWSDGGVGARVAWGDGGWVVGWRGDVAWGDAGVGGRVGWRCGMG